MTENSERIDLTVSRNVRTFRTARGITQSDLGEEIGVTFQQVQKIEKGINSLATGRMRRLCKVLSVTPNELFGITPQNKVEDIPALSTWATRMALKLEKLDSKSRRAIDQVIQVLLPH